MGSAARKTADTYRVMEQDKEVAPGPVLFVSAEVKTDIIHDNRVFANVNPIVYGRNRKFSD
ncbi:MAG: hypothetical protein NC541_12260 [bacterium]|nr:hypothetical protein [bacterium]